jgi:hypothetical protein
VSRLKKNVIENFFFVKFEKKKSLTRPTPKIEKMSPYVVIHPKAVCARVANKSPVGTKGSCPWHDLLPCTCQTRHDLRTHERHGLGNHLQSNTNIILGELTRFNNVRYTPRSWNFLYNKIERKKKKNNKGI